MNTYTSQLSHFHSSHTTRAHFSPISRVANHSAKHAAADSDQVSVVDEIATDGTTATESVAGRFWTPGLLDRLQAPLTRYHD